VLAQLWIARGDPARARYHAKDLLALTARNAEATWRALALEVAAQIAMCERDLPRAREHITDALSIVERFEIPVAAWRVQALAASFFESTGDMAWPSVIANWLGPRPLIVRATRWKRHLAGCADLRYPA
jgi:ATP/maltotriose-dependent transcriptional regulator MalT